MSAALIFDIPNPNPHQRALIALTDAYLDGADFTVAELRAGHISEPQLYGFVTFVTAVCDALENLKAGEATP